MESEQLLQRPCFESEPQNSFVNLAAVLTFVEILLVQYQCVSQNSNSSLNQGT